MLENQINSIFGELIVNYKSDELEFDTKSYIGKLVSTSKQILFLTHHLLLLK